MFSDDFLDYGSGFIRIIYLNPMMGIDEILNFRYENMVPRK
jgi:hypothetical protein